MKEKKILVLDLSKDFWIEAEQSEDAYDFWLCRKDYCIKIFAFGTPIFYEEDLPTALKDNEDLLKDYNYMRPYFEDLLEEDEDIDEHFNIVK